MRVFNSIQMVALFAILPLLINWTSAATFPGAAVANIVCWAIYITLGFFLTFVVANSKEIWS